MKLWSPDSTPDTIIERFTSGDDPVLDRRLVSYDCRASAAHAEMLCSIGVLTEEELHELEQALGEIVLLDARGEFTIRPEDEDCHTAIENYLTEVCGDAGRKIHTARSRNDQVLTALRLYTKEALDGIKEKLGAYREALAGVKERFGAIPLPGYTHTQRAMPTTVETWAGSFDAAAADDLVMLCAVRSLVDQNPLGTAAGFGVPGLTIDRTQTTRRLKFAKVLENPLYAQLSRGRTEGVVLGLCTQILLGLNRLSTDLVLFASREFGFVKLAREHTTGSSIMPQKRNPDVLELVRARHHTVLGYEMTVKSTAANLISGYHRDLQLTKEPLMRGLDAVRDCLEAVAIVLGGLSFDEERCRAAITDEMFATGRVYERVRTGVPFRTAYRDEAEKYTPAREGYEPADS